MASGAEADPLELGVFRPQLVPVKQLVAGEVGYVATGLKSVRDAQVGDTVTTVARPARTRRYPATRRPRASSSPASIRSAARTIRCSAMRSRSCTSTTRSFTYAPAELGRARPSASAALPRLSTYRRGEVGYVATGLKSVRDAQVGDTVTTVARPADEPLPGYQEAKSLVFAGHLPGQRRGLPAPARCAREAPPQRRQLHLHAGELGRARLRVPLRLPRPAPHGDRPGAARARVLARPHRLGAVGRVPRPADARPRHGRRRQPGAAPEPGRHRGDRGAVGQAQRGHAEPATSAR